MNEDFAFEIGMKCSKCGGQGAYNFDGTFYCFNCLVDKLDYEPEPEYEYVDACPHCGCTDTFNHRSQGDTDIYECSDCSFIGVVYKDEGSIEDLLEYARAEL